jgi:hypothetical protein
VTPAAAAISAIVVSSYPRSANSRKASLWRRARVIGDLPTTECYILTFWWQRCRLPLAAAGVALSDQRVRGRAMPGRSDRYAGRPGGKRHWRSAVDG